MRKILVLTMLVITISLSIPAYGELNLNKASFSSNVELNENYRWNIEEYLVNDRRITLKTSPGSFEFVHGSKIDLTILQDPSDIDLAAKDTLSDASNFSDYFKLVYDDLTFTFEKADPLYIWFFPVSGVSSNGESVDLLEEFWIYNVYNILRNGETLNFNSSLPEGTVDTSSNDNELTLTLEIGQTDLQARVDSTNGIMNAVNFVSSSPDLRIEINRRGSGGSSALSVSPVWSIIPLVLIPVAIRQIRKL